MKAYLDVTGVTLPDEPFEFEFDAGCLPRVGEFITFLRKTGPFKGKTTLKVYGLSHVIDHKKRVSLIKVRASLVMKP